MKIGVCLESTGLSFREVLPFAARLGIGGVQVNAVRELSPDQLGDTARREVRNLLKTYNQHLTAFNCPLRYGIDVAENLQPRLEYIRKTMSLAQELGTRTVIIPCPKLPVDGETARADMMREALADLARHGDRIGVLLSLEFGLDSPDAMKAYVDAFDVGSLKINYDPANMFVNGFDPVQGLMTLHQLIVHTHARDVRKTSISMGASEVSLGSGDINWLAYIATLSVIEYRGWIAIERNATKDQQTEITNSVNFLKRMTMPI